MNREIGSAGDARHLECRAAAERAVRLAAALLLATLPLSSAIPADAQPPNREVSPMAKTRASVLAGSWYASDPQELARSVDAHIAQGRALSEVADAPPVLVIVPHAGHQWSGRTAGHIYRLLSGAGGRAIERVIMLGPSHRMGFRGASVPDFAAYETPLGSVAVDQQAAAALREHSLFGSIGAAHSQEHCLEIQLPFLQRALQREFRILPILVSQLSRAEWARAAEALQPLIDERTLLLISSDFTHFGAHFDYYPFRENVDENLRRLDKGALAPILTLDAQAFADYHQETDISVCGYQPIGIALELLRSPVLHERWGGPPEGRVLDYLRSADLTGDLDGSVSYAAVAFFPPGKLKPGADYPPALATVSVWGTKLLSAAAQDYLLALARRTVTELVTQRRIAQPGDYPPGVSARKLQKVCGVFVTLEKQGRLRGCIGSIVGTQPLVAGVVQNAVSAATRDPRFPPVTPEELGELSIEISVLTPLRRARGPAEIEIGRHGVVLKQGNRQAVFLPQVAPEQGWDRDTMLEHLALKAGLPAGAWRDPATTFDLFEAFVFSEGEEGAH